MKLVSEMEVSSRSLPMRDDLAAQASLVKPLSSIGYMLPVGVPTASVAPE